MFRNLTTYKCLSVRGMEGMRVIELGAGTGVVGLAAALLGASVTLTDQHQLIPLLRHNIDVLGVGDRVSLHTYDWGGDRSHLGDEPFDLIIVSDCVLPKLYPIEPLVQAIADLSFTTPHTPETSHTLTLMSYEHRIYQHFDPRKKFESLALERGLHKRVIPLSDHDEVYQAEDIEIWEYGCTPTSVDGVTFDVSESTSVTVNVCEGGATHPIVLTRKKAGSIGSDLWASSLLMARHVWMERDAMRGKRVVELGAGIGVVSAVLSHIGCVVTSTDKVELSLPPTGSLQSQYVVFL